MTHFSLFSLFTTYHRSGRSLFLSYHKQNKSAVFAGYGLRFAKDMRKPAEEIAPKIERITWRSADL